MMSFQRPWSCQVAVGTNSQKHMLWRVTHSGAEGEGMSLSSYQASKTPKSHFELHSGDHGRPNATTLHTWPLWPRLDVSRLLDSCLCLQFLKFKLRTQLNYILKARLLCTLYFYPEIFYKKKVFIFFVWRLAFPYSHTLTWQAGYMKQIIQLNAWKNIDSTLKRKNIYKTFLKWAVSLHNITELLLQNGLEGKTKKINVYT